MTAPDLESRPLAAAKLVGGRLCLDFVNTIGGRKHRSSSEIENYAIRADRLNDYFDLLAWGRRVELLAESDAQFLARKALEHKSEAAAVWKRAVDLREAIYRTLKASLSARFSQPSDLEILTNELKLARSHMKLAAGKDGFRLEWNDPRDKLDRVLWAVVDSAAEVLTASDMTRVRQCPGEDCGWLFDDSTRNRSRQWCDMKDCGNIAKVRRFRSRISRSKTRKTSKTKAER